MVSDVLEIIFDGLEFLVCGIIEIIISIFWWIVSFIKWLISRVLTIALTIVITQHQKELVDFIKLSVHVIQNHLNR
ncbi:hypothetical protein [Lactococcus lactis]|uniref:hypothetical protein n=1 Tax=Lactococcus lactis TaxID=1358 RepID=UPI001914802D|nr:hypothetical protein [Lactococcus lactis]WDA68481.1 hypothetical protein IL310_13275 [Lactococcus lactis]